MTATVDAPSPDHETEAHEHPSDFVYLKVALVLAVLTGIEVFTYFAQDGAIRVSRNGLVPLILVIMVVKFAIVAMYFMHLKFDPPVFRRVFLAGLIIALIVFIAALTMMQIWWDSGIPEDYEDNIALVTEGGTGEAEEQDEAIAEADTESGTADPAG